MSVFEVGGSNTWNYSDDTKDNYSEQLSGTVVEVAYVQALDFQTKQPVFWPDGNPKCNFRFTICDANGNEFAWFISTNIKSNGLAAVLNALDPGRGPNDRGDVSKVLGKHVAIATKPGSYNANRPRPWWFKVIGDGDQSKVRGLVDEVHQPKAQAAQAPAAPAGFDDMATGARAAQAAIQGGAPVSEQVPADVYGDEIPF